MKQFALIEGNPDYRAVQNLIDVLKSVEGPASKEGAFNMLEGKLCGSVHCIAGWAAVASATLWDKVIRLWVDQGYHVGIQRIDTILGTDTILWAQFSHEIWGNAYGDGMFCSTSAYNYPGFSGAIRHWEEVRDRLKAIQA